MTNWEEFKEVFRIPNNIEPVGDICDILSCEYVSCQDCIFSYGHFWNQEYKGEKMIQIIKRGTRKTCTCKECGCLFSYESEDVKIGGTGYHGGDYSYIKCPQCNVEIYLTEEK